MDYGINEQAKWDRLAFGKCKHAFLLEALKEVMKIGKALDKETQQKAETIAEEWASMSMRIKDESLYKGQPQQPFRNDVIRSKVENKTNNVPFN